MTTKNLISVSKEVRRLEKLVSDMEWEDQDPRAEIRELMYYKDLQRRGVEWEPTF